MEGLPGADHDVPGAGANLEHVHGLAETAAEPLALTHGEAGIPMVAPHVGAVLQNETTGLQRRMARSERAPSRLWHFDHR